MDLTPDLIFRHRSHDVEDIALEFVEQELGRFDWRNNWATAKASGALPQRIQAWLEAVGTNADAQEIIQYIDTLVADRPGRWR